MNISQTAVQTDKLCDLIPVVSTATNLFNLFQKAVILPFVAEKGHYYTHLDQKSFTSCLTFSVPVLGNIAVALMNKAERESAENLQDFATLVNKVKDCFQKEEAIERAISKTLLTVMKETIEQSAEEATAIEIENAVSSLSEKVINQAIAEIRAEVATETHIEHISLMLAKESIKEAELEIAIEQIVDTLCDEAATQVKIETTNDVASALVQSSITKATAEATEARNRKLVIEKVRNNALVLTYAEKKYQDDYEVVTAALNSSKDKKWTLRHPGIVQYISQRLQNNKEIVFAAIAYWASTIAYFDKKWRSDQEVMEKAIKKDPSTLYYASDALKSNWSFVKIATDSNPRCLAYAKRDAAMQAVQINGLHFEYLDKGLKKDEKICLAAMRQNIDAYKLIDPDLQRNNKQIAIAALQGGMYYSFQGLSPELAQDKQVIQAYETAWNEALQSNRRAINSFHKQRQSEKIYSMGQDGQLVR